MMVNAHDFVYVALEFPNSNVLEINKIFIQRYLRVYPH